jgi:branched-chain amino acid transport system ATP-binding protein
MSRENILVVEGVSKSFGGRVALDGASLEVAKGSITGVIGPNGSGKSTLFNIVAGTLRAGAGRVLLKGRDISRATPA